MLSSARTFSKQVLSHRTQIQQQTKTQLRNQQHGSTQHTSAPRTKDQRYDGAAGESQPAPEPKGAVLEKMRLENRERKKRWRELNEERNKDNDLRCRVNKRANQLYGAHASEAKDKWIGEEFERRQMRRKEKELRKRPLDASPAAAAEEEGVQQHGSLSEAAAAAAAEPAAGAGTGTVDADEQRVAKCARRAAGQDAAAAASMSLSVSASTSPVATNAMSPLSSPPSSTSLVLPLHQRLPLGFGSYAGLPRHQARAAYDFWRSAAEHHALEQQRRAAHQTQSRTPSSGASEQAAAPTLPAVSAAAVVSAASAPVTPAHGAGYRDQPLAGGITLPPLSSIVPHECLPRALASAPAAAAAAAAADAAAFATPVSAPASASAPDALLRPPHCSSNPPSHVVRAPLPPLGSSTRSPLSSRSDSDSGSLYLEHEPAYWNHVSEPYHHVRPWEEREAQLSSASPVPEAYGLAMAASPPPYTQHLHARGAAVSDAEMAGLSEAAFSLMTLSSSAPPPQHTAQL
ncbi:hypothetical protein GGI07_005254 [Coemansia sp. Benny D115]|nr:hypothetical protein GGI07_005254 [Coemansia sp. Benny D115]